MSEVVSEMRLSNNLLWSIPVTLAVDTETADTITTGEEVALCENGKRFGCHGSGRKVHL